MIGTRAHRSPLPESQRLAGAALEDPEAVRTYCESLDAGRSTHFMALGSPEAKLRLKKTGCARRGES